MKASSSSSSSSSSFFSASPPAADSSPECPAGIQLSSSADDEIEIAGHDAA